MHCAKCFFYESDVGDDLCNRCGRAFMPEANVYLGLLLLVTGGAAWTLRNLLTGSADPFVHPTFGLGLWAAWPVSIVDCPAYGLVVGAWLAMLAAPPILMGIMYGKRGGWLMTIGVALLGPDPLMAAAIAAGVWVAAGWTLRLQGKVLSALVGLVPVAVYWFAATATTDFGKGEPGAVAGASWGAAAAPTLPRAFRSLAYVPPITAVIVSVAASILVVLIGRADRWHIRWPAALLAVLAMGPVLALLAIVGLDEVRYALLREPEGVSTPLAAPEAARLQEFVNRYPDSRHAPEVLARLAMQAERMENGSRPGPPPRKSGDVWKEVRERHAQSAWAADAWLHLADAESRQGLFQEAEKEYWSALSKASITAQAAEDPQDRFNFLWHLFSIRDDLRAKEEEAKHLRGVRYEILTHLALVLENRKGTQNSSRALALYFVAQGLAGTNGYRPALQAVLEADPGGPLSDNVAYDLAMCEPDDPKDLKRIEQLRAVAAAWPASDGAMLAHLAAAGGLIARAETDPAAMREARPHLVAAQAELAKRAARNPLDPYVQALADTVEKELLYVQTKLSTPEEPH